MYRMAQRMLSFWGREEIRDLHKIILDGDGEALKNILRLSVPYQPDCNLPRTVRLRSGRIWKEVTPLHLAVLENSPNMIRLLLENGANVHAKDAEGKTPIMRFDIHLLDGKNFNIPKLAFTRMLVENDAIKILDLLFEHGASEEEFVKAFGLNKFEEYKQLSDHYKLYLSALNP